MSEAFRAAQSKPIHARFTKQLRQLVTRVEHARLDGVCRSANDLGYLFDCLGNRRDSSLHDEGDNRSRHLRMIARAFLLRGERHDSHSTEFALVNGEVESPHSRRSVSAHRDDRTY